MSDIREVKTDRVFKEFDIAQAGTPHLHQNLRWFVTASNSVLGVVVLDLVDFDFSAVVMARDHLAPRFTAVDLRHSVPSFDECVPILHDLMRKNLKEFP